MESHRKHITDGSRVGDPMAPSATVALDDPMKMHRFDGYLTVCRFTPPSAEERLDIVRSLSRDEVMDRLVDLRVRNRHEAHVRPDRLPLLRRRRALAHALQWAPEFEVERITTNNLITQSGDQWAGERAAAVSGAVAQVTGMKLGTGSSAPTKTGGASALGAYKTGSDKAIDGGFPTSALVSTARQIQWRTSWGAGVINGSALNEAVIVNDVLADATSTSANTISRALFGPMTLGASDTLVITWNYNFLGA